MKDFDLKIRTKKFAHRCVKLALALPKSIVGRHLAAQLIRSSTSIAANYRAACVAQSKPSFASKISISYEEADETYFWIEFILDEELIPEIKLLPLLKESDELTRILAASRKTSVRRKPV